MSRQLSIPSFFNCDVVDKKRGIYAVEDEERASNTGNAYQPAAADTAGESSGSNLGEKKSFICFVWRRHEK